MLIDGGHLRSVARRAGLSYEPDFIEAFAHACPLWATGESLHRILYYDCPLFRGQKPLPVSGKPYNFSASDNWLTDLGSRDYFALRLGTLAFRGWVPKKRGQAVTDEDFRPNFEQKGVDMRIGLDMAVIASTKQVQRIIIVTSDTDIVPAMKHVRTAGLQVVAVQLPSPALPLSPQLLAQVDFKRDIQWPERPLSESIG